MVVVGGSLGSVLGSSVDTGKERTSSRRGTVGGGAGHLVV